MFYTIKNEISDELVEKKSKFIADLFIAKNQEEAEAKIKEIKKRYYDAKHHCFAYITFDKEGKKMERCSDDGEPSGTAGAPMLELLRGKSLCNVGVVVTRYFGGILLGTRRSCKSICRSYKKGIRTSRICRKKVRQRG